MSLYLCVHGGYPHHTRKTHWRSPWLGPVTVISIVIRGGARIGRSSSLLLAVQLHSQTINFQLHGFGILLIRDVAPTSRLAPSSMSGMHANFPIPSSLNIEKMILMLGSHRFLLIQTWAYYNWTLNSLLHKKFPTDDANCKASIWFIEPKGLKDLGPKNPMQ